MQLKNSNIITQIISTASKDESIKELYLFGSHARGTANAFSDIDIAVIHVDVAKINRAALNETAEKNDTDIQFTYVMKDIFETDNHPLHVSSSIKREGVLLWQR